MSSTREEIISLLKLGVPMMVAQGGLTTMGLVDSFVVGRVSARDMGAVALGNGIVGVLVVLGIGLAMGIEPLVSQAYGAGERQSARHWLWQGIWVALLAAIPISALILVATMFFEPFGVPAPIAKTTTAYLWARVPGLAFNTVYTCCRSYLTSIGRWRPILIAVVTANVLNAIIDAVLVFGFGYGAVGVGLATSICWVVMTAIVLGTIQLEDRTIIRPRRADMARVFRLGWPTGLQISLEVGIFTVVSLLIARFGEVALAGHQIALALASATFMGAVGLAVATAARVGQHIGAARSELARRTGFLGIALGAGFMATGGLAFLLFANELATFFAPTDPQAAKYGAVLLRIAAVFAISDGIQVVAAGALRGAGDTKWPFYANLLAHWAIGLPLTFVFGHVLGLGPAGYWWALTAGLSCVSILLAIRFAILSAKPIARV